MTPAVPEDEMRPLLRDDIRNLEGYHSPQLNVSVRLNTNESPLPPPSGFVGDWLEAVRTIPLHRYPDRTARDLRGALGEFLGQPADRLFMANGSNEVLQTIFLGFGGHGRSAVVFEPSYALHPHIARITGTEVVSCDRLPDFTLSPSVARAAVTEHQPDIVVLCNPNNPTGLVEQRSTVEAVLEAVAPTTLVVVDEAYAEFADWSAIDLVDGDARLVVVRTYSKIWSMAALRLGFCVGASKIVADLESVALPYRLSTPTQLAGMAALRHEAEMASRVRMIVSERERVMAALGEMEHVEPFPSGANFILFRLGDKAHAVWQALMDRGVLVRDFSSWPRLEGCLRVTIGTNEENDAFLETLDLISREDA